MATTRDFLTEHYHKMWANAFDQLRQGEVSIDPLLAKRGVDQRRSLTVLARPNSQVQKKVSQFLKDLREVEPKQYYYDPGELHVTGLSLFTATLDHARMLTRFNEYVDAVQAALAQAPSFEIEFRGVTLSQEAILIQGFPADEILNDLRKKLRRELRARNLIEGLDARYILQTAHMTSVRFREPLRDSRHFSQILEKYRSTEFGQTTVKELHLVCNDWYMSRQSVELLRRFPLG